MQGHATAVVKEIFGWF